MDVEQQSKKSKKKKADKSKKKTKKVKTKRVSATQPKNIEVDEASDTPVKIYTNVPNHAKIKKILKSSSLIQLKTHSPNEVIIPINENRLDIFKKSKICSLVRDTNLDKSLQTEYNKRVKTNPNLQRKSSLPIFEKQDEILDLIKKNQVTVIHGEPQTGKTTQIPQFILNRFMQSGKGSLCKIVSTQPYKKNVASAFQKVCDERRAIFGNADGISFQYRFDSLKTRNSGSIKYCTSGILLKQIANSLFFNEITHLIIDEIQKRDEFTDFLLAIIKKLITKRTYLKLILICNTIYSKKISKYFDKCANINVTGELYPVDEYYLGDILQLINLDNIIESTEENALTSFVQNYEKSDKLNVLLLISLIEYILNEYKAGDILILLPSISDVHLLPSKLEDNKSINSNTQIINSEVQYTSKRKIFLSTNERFVNLNSSDIIFVIDCGQIQVKFCDVITNIETMKNDWISQKTSYQRKNFAGRKNPGICFHLFSEEIKQNFEKYPIPEILLSSNLEEIILKIKEFGIENAELFLNSFLTCPAVNCIRKTIENFKTSNIIDSEELLTPLGYHVSKLPLKYSVGKMVILGAFFSCLEPILNIAVYFSLRSIFIGNVSKKRKKQSNSYDSDTLFILELLNECEKSSKNGMNNLIRSTVFKDIDNIIQQLTDKLLSMNLIHSREFKNEEYNVNSKNIPLIKALLATALYPNIAVIRNHTSNKLRKISIETIIQRKVFIHPSSINREKTNLPSPLLIYRTLVESKHDFVREVTFLSPLQVLFFANDVKYSTENQNSVIIVADSLKILCTTNTSSIIKSVQEQFNIWFEYKLKYPTWVKWGTDTCILRAVVELLDNETNINDFSVLENNPNMINS